MGLGKKAALLSIGFLLLAATVSFAETGTTTTDIASAPAAAANAKIIAGADLRPTWDPASNVFRTEDTFELGYQFRAGRTLSYIQALTTNIDTPNEALGLNPQMDRGFIKTGISKLLTDESSGFSFGYQNRIYLPTAAYDRDAGVLSLVRNYANFSKKINNHLSVTLSEIPIFQINSRAGTGIADKAVANAVFENRVYLTTDIQITDNLSLSVPVMFHQTRFGNYQLGAKNNDKWTYFVWVYPEITYSLGGGTSVGFAYYSANLIKADLSDLDLDEGFSKGSLQVAFTAYL